MPVKDTEDDRRRSRVEREGKRFSCRHVKLEVAESYLDEREVSCRWAELGRASGLVCAM